jgi:hypothetical protein
MAPIGQSLSSQKTAVSLLEWGREGTGKTTSALRMTQLNPKGRVVLINAEAGAKKQALIQHGIDPDRVEIWPPDEKGPGYITYETLEAEVVNPMRAALEKDPDAYIGVVIDSFSEVARRILEDVTAKAYAKAQALGKNRDRWMVELQDHGVAASQMRSLLRRFRDLNIHLVITALERRDVDENTGMVSYGPALGPSVGNDTMGLVDLVAFCQVENVGGIDFRTATFTPTQTRRAKDRYGVLPVTMVDPFIDRIVGYVDGTITKENDPARARLLAAVSKPVETDEVKAATEAAKAPDAKQGKQDTAPAVAAKETAPAAS